MSEPVDLSAPSLYINRELSLLEFQRRFPDDAACATEGPPGDAGSGKHPCRGGCPCRARSGMLFSRIRSAAEQAPGP